MIWWIVIGTNPGDLRTGKCYAQRVHANSMTNAAIWFFKRNPPFSRCIVTCIDPKMPGYHQTYVVDRVQAEFDVEIRR